MRGQRLRIVFFHLTIKQGQIPETEIVRSHSIGIRMTSGFTETGNVVGYKTDGDEYDDNHHQDEKLSYLICISLIFLQNQYEYENYEEDGTEESEDEFAGPSLGDLGDDMFISEQQKEFQRKQMEVSDCLLFRNSSSHCSEQAQSIRDKYRSPVRSQKLLFHSKSSLREAVQEKRTVAVFEWNKSSSVIAATNTEM
jgi:hypothetical protein